MIKTGVLTGMRTATGKDGTFFYLGQDVDVKIFELESRIKELENELSISKNTNKGGNVANLTPRQPTYDERIQRQIARRVSSGESKNKLSKEFNVSRGTILNYCRKFEPVKTPKSQFEFGEELILEEDVPVTKKTDEPRATEKTNDSMAAVQGSDILGTKSISPKFTDVD